MHDAQLMATPFFREAGTGPGVVCLHANASSSSQWRALTDRLAGRFRVLAPDLMGAGKSSGWPADGRATLLDEVAFLEPVFQRAGDPFVVVAHSYGAAVALVAAMSQPERICALALYEPTLFALLDRESAPPNDADGIRQVAALSVAALDAGNPDRAAAIFIDYWMGNGTWERTPEARKPSIIASVRNAREWTTALFSEPTPLSAFSALNIPILYMTGTESPASSRGVARLLLSVLPHVQHVEFNGIGHMGPVTHADTVNDVIGSFIESAVRAKNG
jgi:pimeloyl-ACP methyl ester carboxylesterase